MTDTISQNQPYGLASFVRVAQIRGRLLWDQCFPGGDSKVLYNFVANRTVRSTLSGGVVELPSILKGSPSTLFFRPMTGSYRNIMFLLTQSRKKVSCKVLEGLGFRRSESFWTRIFVFFLWGTLPPSIMGVENTSIGKDGLETPVVHFHHQ